MSEYILTDLCAWEKHKQDGTRSDRHAIFVAEKKTGKLFMIKSGATIKVVDGEVTEMMNQETYNQNE